MFNLIPDNAYVVVADGGGGKLFRNTGSGGAASLHELRRLFPRGLADDGPSGSRPVKQTPRQTDEVTFAKQLGQAQSSTRACSECKDIVLVLDPQTLGQVRGCMGREAEASIARTPAEDFTNSPVKDTEKALSN